MTEDLTPSIQNVYDTVRFDRGVARNVTIVQFYLGRRGPFEQEFDRAPDKYAIERAIQERKAAIEGIG